MCAFGVLWLSCEAPAAPSRVWRRGSGRRGSGGGGFSGRWSREVQTNNNHNNHNHNNAKPRTSGARRAALPSKV